MLRLYESCLHYRSPLVAFGMKDMQRTCTFVSLLISSMTTQAQDIKFDQGGWTESDLKYQRRMIVTAENAERVDSVYTENLTTGELELAIQTYPLARYEYFPFDEQFPPLLRRVDIRQETQSDSAYVERLDGSMELIIQRFIIDIPNGTYQEFYPNGMIRITGTLDGYNPDGTLKKTGTWMEWDAAGNVIREEHYP